MHNLPVTPINPRAAEIILPSRTYATVKGPSSLSSPSQTSLSFLTPPPVTRKVLQEAKAAGVKAVWLQPGSFEAEDLEYAKANFESAVGGTLGPTSGDEGWCVLVDGERALAGAGRQWSRQKL
jgi:predicted CoA-binding protein